MKKIVVVLVSLLVAVLIGVGNAFAQDKTHEASIPEPSLSSKWKPVFKSKLETLYFNTKKITYLPGDIVKVWTLGVPRGEFRRGLVNALKHDLTSEGKDPNNAERVWYVIQLGKLNCETNQYAPLETTFYSFGDAVLDHQSVQYEEWEDIVPGSPDKIVENYVCKKHK